MQHQKENHRVDPITNINGAFSSPFIASPTRCRYWQLFSSDREAETYCHSGCMHIVPEGKNQGFTSLANSTSVGNMLRSTIL